MAATAFGRPVHLVALREAIVAGMDGLAPTAPPMAEMRFADILARDADLLAVLEVADAPLGDGIRYRLPDLPLEAANEAATIDRTLVPAVLPTIDDTYGHDASHCPLPAGWGRPPGKRPAT
ncbi:hypothetical protein SDC9_149435 [bioreactor metagenome]|uniref:Uncharacterized protein n=1 Tax=bioreactor metagenome TaxID=1076179 RepID=A0A645EJR3_9ZZZZ